MTKKMRLLPLSIIMMSLLLGVKIVDFTFGVEAAIANSSEQEKEAEPDQKPEDTQQDAAQTDENTADTTPVKPLSSVPTRKEIEYLQKLSQRREELDQKARELDNREKLLEAVEKRIIERTASLKQIETTIAGLLNQHDEREKAQLDSLVKIYSAMKPKEAAQIFDNLDEDVLISIVENMSERKMGAILAKMNINRAKQLTTSLATRKKLPKIEG